MQNRIRQSKNMFLFYIGDIVLVCDLIILFPISIF